MTRRPRQNYSPGSNTCDPLAHKANKSKPHRHPWNIKEERQEEAGNPGPEQATCPAEAAPIDDRNFTPSRVLGGSTEPPDKQEFDLSHFETKPHS